MLMLIVDADAGADEGGICWCQLGQRIGCNSKLAAVTGDAFKR